MADSTPSDDVQATPATSVPTCALGVPFLRVLPPDALQELGRAMRHRRYGKGERIAWTGDPVEHLVVVARGRLKAVSSTAAGREQVVRTLAPGEFIGELGLFTPAHHQSDLVAVQSSEVCLVPRQAVQALLRSRPEVGLRLIETLAQRLAEAEHTISDLGLRDVGQRLAAELVRVSATATPGAGGPRVRMPLPWVELAARLGTTPESLSRRLKALVDQGVIRQEGARTVVIVAPERLRQLAER